MNRIIIMIFFIAMTTYLTRAIPLVLYKGKEPTKFVKSFLEYIPYAALSGLLFPEVLFSTGSVVTSLIGCLFAGILILKKQNMLIVVMGTIILVYMMNMYF
ncbi:AzlD domain-containing protein [Clostridium aestuarii]|uniref:AzlD domain-containing protein n=1 Tax=Clostridium aestuarii TaxID=338193 RepID=A0ABT4CZD2_9CLOT|nr:AzlD domain-containing protein [Clostridium aestuarii]MCY6484344.1 AzlD domain-containing protein [Clostridium aestuarii]